MSIVQRVKTAKDAREMLVENALVEALEKHGQLPTRFENDTDGTVRIWFSHGARFVARWDHSGERSAYVGQWIIDPRFDA